jgi:lipoprotein signal peptidase
MNDAANRSFRWLFWTLVVVGLCLDQGTKYGMFAWLQPANDNDGRMHQAEVVADVFYFTTKYTYQSAADDTWRSPLRTISSDLLPEVNHGALWGIGGRDENGSDFNHIFALISVVAAVAIVLWSFRRATAQDRWLCMALGLILAGTLGNLYDRVVFHGVRDFLDWIYLFRFATFNIADSCLVCGASLLLLQALFASPKDEKKETAVAAEAAAPAETAAVK